MAAAGLRIRNPALYEEVPCSNCGKIYERRWMEELNTGRSVQRLCPECYHHAAMDIYAARGERVYHMNKIKKR